MHLDRVPPVFWRGKVEKPQMQWEHLDSLCARVLKGDKNVLPSIQKVIDAGYLAEMALAIEYAVSPDISAQDREEAFIQLRLFETYFDAYWKDPKDVSLQDRYAHVISYEIEARKQGLDLDINNEEILNFVFNLVQIHEFLHKKMEAMCRNVFPSGLSDFLLRRSDSDGSNIGSCFPMAVLAAHLGRRIDLSLKAYFSEDHVSLFAPVGKGFFYEPTCNGTTLLDHPDKYIDDLKAPRETSPVSDGEFLLVPPLVSNRTQTQLLTSSGIPILDDFFPDNFQVAYVILLSSNDESVDRLAKKERAIARALKLFPDHLLGRLLQVDLLIQKGCKQEALERLDQIWDLIQRRHIRAQNGSRHAEANSLDILNYYRLRKYFYESARTDAADTVVIYFQISALLPPKSIEMDEVLKGIEEVALS